MTDIQALHARANLQSKFVLISLSLIKCTPLRNQPDHSAMINYFEVELFKLFIDIYVYMKNKKLQCWLFPLSCSLHTHC